MAEPSQASTYDSCVHGLFQFSKPNPWFHVLELGDTSVLNIYSTFTFLENVLPEYRQVNSTPAQSTDMLPVSHPTKAGWTDHLT